jgi:hypothetical protein
MRQRACGAQSRLEPGLLPWAVSAGRTLPQAGALGTALLLQPLSVCSPYSQLPEWVMARGELMPGGGSVLRRDNCRAGIHEVTSVALQKPRG